MSGIIYLDCVSSTNTYAKNCLESGRPSELTAYIAHEQTVGRGQGGSIWESAPGMNHTSSMVFYPVFPGPSRQFLMSQCVSLAIVKTLEHYMPRHLLSIKWPNDILADGKKIAGILMEASLTGNRFDYVIAGTGVNVNQEHFSSFSSPATSIHKITGYSQDLKEFNSLLYITICQYYKIACVRPKQVERAYLHYMHLYKTPWLFRSGDQFFTGIIRGVDDTGCLLISLKDGTIKHFAFKEVFTSTHLYPTAPGFSATRQENPVGDQ